MSGTETKEIVLVRVRKVGMVADDDVLDEISNLCRACRGTLTCLACTREKPRLGPLLVISKKHLSESLGICLDEAGEIIRQDYATAIQSSQPGNLLKQALLACAMAEQDEFGSFTAGAVREPYTRI